MKRRVFRTTKYECQCSKKGALALRVPAPIINDVIRQKRGVSIDTALRLARYFNSTPQFWMNLQTGQL